MPEGSTVTPSNSILRLQHEKKQHPSPSPKVAGALARPAQSHLKLLEEEGQQRLRCGYERCKPASPDSRPLSMNPGGGEWPGREAVLQLAPKHSPHQRDGTA